MADAATQTPECCILYAEDEENDFSFLKHALEQTGSRVRLLRAHNGLEARQIIESDTCLFDAVITDLRMPNCNGYELLQWYASTELAKKSPVFVLSTSALSRDSELCSRLGATRYFTKPNSPKGYAQLAREILTTLAAHAR